MYLSPYFLEHHVQQHLEQISQDRIDTDIALSARRTAPLGTLRARIGAALIVAGERIGGGHVAPVRTEPRPAGDFSLGF